MIRESAPWKDRLARDADLIDRWARKPVTERRSFMIEHKIFLAAYSMRKLIEGLKLSNSFEAENVRCEVFSLRSGKRLSRRDPHLLDENYDLMRPVGRTVGVPELLDTIIHSLLFVEALREEDTVQGFYVTSDKRSSKLWLVPLRSFTKLMRHAAEDYPSSIHLVFDPETGDPITWRGHGELPPAVRAKFADTTRRAIDKIKRRGSTKV